MAFATLWSLETGLAHQCEDSNKAFATFRSVERAVRNIIEFRTCRSQQFRSLEHGVRNILEVRTWRSQLFGVWKMAFATCWSLEHGVRNIVMFTSKVSYESQTHLPVITCNLPVAVRVNMLWVL
jgi:hypothetical protein